jgi:hypothetical protein
LAQAQSAPFPLFQHHKNTTERVTSWQLYDRTQSQNNHFFHYCPVTNRKLKITNYPNSKHNIEKRKSFCTFANPPQKKHPREKQGNPIEISNFVFGCLPLPNG